MTEQPAATAAEKYREYMAAYEAGDVVEAHKKWREYLAAVEAEMQKKKAA